jgi:hypothetical protein
MAPTGINRPGFPSASSAKRGVFAASPRTPTNINRPGTSSPDFRGYSRPDRDNDGPNIVMKSKPNVPTFRQPPGQSVFAPTTSSYARKQYYDRLGGGPAPLQDILNITQKYNRAADIPGYQAKMRDFEAFQKAQANDGIARFSQGPLKGQQILSMREPQLTAMAPTFSQLMGDIGGAFSSMGQGLAEKGTPMMNLVKDLFGGVQNFFTGSQGPGTTAQGPQNMGLTPGQMNLYNNLVGNGMNPAMALEQAKRYNPQVFPKSFAMGGIATLN